MSSQAPVKVFVVLLRGRGRERDASTAGRRRRGGTDRAGPGTGREAESAPSGDALAALAEGDWETAAATLRDRYESVCERVHPVLGDDRHPAACHLYGVPAESAVEKFATTSERE